MSTSKRKPKPKPTCFHPTATGNKPPSKRDRPLIAWQQLRIPFHPFDRLPLTGRRSHPPHITWSQTPIRWHSCDLKYSNEPPIRPDPLTHCQEIYRKSAGFHANRAFGSHRFYFVRVCKYRKRYYIILVCSMYFVNSVRERGPRRESGLSGFRVPGAVPLSCRILFQRVKFFAGLRHPSIIPDLFGST